MKQLPVMSAIVLLSVCCVACGRTFVSTTVTQARRPPQDDNHIRTYGYAASGANKQEITTLVKRYYAAAAADDGATACLLISMPLAKAVPEDYGQVPGPPSLRGKTCKVVLTKLFKQVPGQPVAVLAATKVTGVRLNGNHGFVQLSSKAMPTGEIVVERDSGSWKLGALIGRACIRCSAG